MLNERKYCVYMHKNKITGKVYIGATCLNVKRRWENGALYKGNKSFSEDIKNYGWDNFEHIILEDDLNNEKAKEKEKYYIDKYKYNCYNKTKGGEQGHIKYLNNDDYEQSYKDKIQRTIRKQKENRLENNAYQKNYYYANEKYHQYKIQYQRDYRAKQKLLKAEP